MDDTRLTKEARESGEVTDDTPLFYIVDTRQVVGNCVLFWAIDRQGYTCELDKAGLYTADEIERLRDTDHPFPKEMVEALAIRHVRAEPLGRLRAAEPLGRRRLRNREDERA